MLTVLGLLGVVLGAGVANAKKQKNKQAEYLNSVEEVFDKIDKGGTLNVTVNGVSPIKLRRGEQLVAIHHNVKMGTYKASSRASGGGITFRHNLGGGFAFRAASGHMARHKDWVFDEEGSLYITSKGVFFKGRTANTTILYDKMSVAVCGDGKTLQIEKQQGKHTRFVLSAKDTVLPAVSAFMFEWSQGRAQI